MHPLISSRIVPFLRLTFISWMHHDPVLTLSCRFLILSGWSKRRRCDRRSSLSVGDEKCLCACVHSVSSSTISYLLLRDQGQEFPASSSSENPPHYLLLKNQGQGFSGFLFLCQDTNVWPALKQCHVQWFLCNGLVFFEDHQFFRCQFLLQIGQWRNRGTLQRNSIICCQRKRHYSLL